ncbi:MAG: Allophanate hydrolase subunit 1 [Idiomarinaceae bacterium HL-53]|nr:MAG: Allophanate hydrolase subunit 1 [Idiomarinaceae bacterium HL-53]CUS49250.1 sensor histidine kinase inhibitor, KipI family [Idiomarinaceae bacterium HL-53]
MTLKVNFQIAGVDALLIQCGDVVSRTLTQQLAQVRNLILEGLPGVVNEVVPAYTTLLVYYEPRSIRLYDLEVAIEKLISEANFHSEDSKQGKLLEVPVCYGGDFGPDLERVAKSANLTTDEVIKLHSQTEYSVAALGFAPGFAYLAGLPEVLVTPRLKTPRKRVPAGSLGIAGAQTAVYPIAGPGGWNLIGRAHQTWFDAHSSPMTPVEVGDRIQFNAVSKAEFEKLMKQGERS